MIGDRNRRIHIWKPSGAVDGANEPIPDDWVLHTSRWANVKGESGLATIRAAASASGINTPLDRYSYRIAYTPSITVSMQVRDPDGSRLQIVAVRHDKAGRDWTDIVAEEGGAGG